MSRRRVTPITEEPSPFAEGIDEVEDRGGYADEEISNLVPIDSIDMEGEATQWP